MCKKHTLTNDYICVYVNIAYVIHEENLHKRDTSKGHCSQKSKCVTYPNVTLVLQHYFRFLIRIQSRTNPYLRTTYTHIYFTYESLFERQDAFARTRQERM